LYPVFELRVFNAIPSVMHNGNYKVQIFLQEKFMTRSSRSIAGILFDFVSLEDLAIRL
jgi:hypothetical protein